MLKSSLVMLERSKAGVFSRWRHPITMKSFPKSNIHICGEELKFDGKIPVHTNSV